LPVEARAILTAFSTASAPEFRSRVGAGAGRQLGEAAADLDVRLVDPDHEALVQVRVDLLVHRRDRGWEAVTGVLAAEAAGEVDVRAAVHILDPGALRARDDDRRSCDPPRDVLLAGGQDSLALGALIDRHDTIVP
jgi:hypothetical protein